MSSFGMRHGFALLCVAGLALGACGSKVEQVSESTGANNTPTKATTTTVETSSDDVASPTTSAPKAAASIAVTESGFSTYSSYDDSQRATAGAVIKNSGAKGASFFEVVFSFKDAAGQPVGTESTYVHSIEPGGVAYAQVGSVELTGAAATVDVAAVVKDRSIFHGTVIPVTVTGVAADTYGDGVQVNGTATNETKDVQDSVGVSCVLRSGGKIVGGASGYLDTMVPGASIAWKASGPVPADAAECAASSSL